MNLRNTETMIRYLILASYLAAAATITLASHYGHAPRPEPTEAPTMPPEIAATVSDMDEGRYVTRRALDGLSDWIRENPEYNN